MNAPNHDLTVAELETTLRELRWTPSEEFAAELDSRAAAGFPRQRGGFRPRLAERVRLARPRVKLLPALAGATTVIVVATAVVVSTNDGNGGGAPSISTNDGGGGGAPSTLNAPAGETGALEKGIAPAPATGGGAELSTPAPPVPLGGGTAPGVRNRKVERSAELRLGTDPEHVQEVAGKVLDVVGRYRGIVLNSSVLDGAEGEAGATFELLIPSRRLSGALAELSRLAEVRSRSENTLDITAPFVSARERLRDARAEAEGLLKQLAEATTETERNSVKAQLRIVRGRIAAFRSQVQRLERRAAFSHVSLGIATGDEAAVPGTGDGKWTIGDALHDAGRILAVGAGVALVSLAVLLPLLLLGGAAWAGRRIYVRRSREQALGA